MATCKICGSYAINRPGTNGRGHDNRDLCDVHYFAAQRDELLAVLKAIISDGVHCDVVPHLHEKAAALIARMEEGK